MLTRFFGLLTIGLLVFACSSSDSSDTDGGSKNSANSKNSKNSENTTNNENNVNFDIGVDADVEDDQAVKPDQGPEKDQDVPKQLDCPGIMSCLTTCQANDMNCFNGCIAQGTTDGTAKFMAMGQCLQPAMTGACSTDCADQASAACNGCIMEACKTQVEACVGGTGTPIDGFGEACEVASPACKSGLTCLGPIQGADPAKGFCSTECGALGMLCPDAPENTSAYCALQMGTATMCIFICQMGNTTYDCPNGLDCGPEDPQQPGVKPCLPLPQQ